MIKKIILETIDDWKNGTVPKSQIIWFVGLEIILISYVILLIIDLLGL